VIRVATVDMVDFVVIFVAGGIPLYTLSLYIHWKELRGKELTPYQEQVSKKIFDNVNFNVVLNMMIANATCWSTDALGESEACTSMSMTSGYSSPSYSYGGYRQLQGDPISVSGSSSCQVDGNLCFSNLNYGNNDDCT